MLLKTTVHIWSMKLKNIRPRCSRTWDLSTNSTCQAYFIQLGVHFQRKTRRDISCFLGPVKLDSCRELCSDEHEQFILNQFQIDFTQSLVYSGWRIENSVLEIRSHVCTAFSKINQWLKMSKGKKPDKKVLTNSSKKKMLQLTLTSDSVLTIHSSPYVGA